MQYRNATNERITVLAKGEAQDGIAATDSIEPGETKSLNVDPHSLQMRAQVDAGNLVPTEAKKAAVKDAAPKAT